MRARTGFSMVEVIIALVLLGVAVLGLQLVAATMVRQTALSQVRLTAAQLAEDRTCFPTTGHSARARLFDVDPAGFTPRGLFEPLSPRQ